MSTSLPDDQDKLIKQLNEIETLEKNHIYPERIKINQFLIIWSSILAPIFFAVAYINGSIEYITFPVTFIIAFFGISGFVSAYLNKTWGFYYAAIAAIGINLYLTAINPAHYSSLITLIDAFTIFNISNQFYRKGYIFGSLFIGIKIVVVYLLFNRSGTLIDFIIFPFSMVFTLGIIPVLIRQMQNQTRSARREKIRAEILSLQNQDLLLSWQNYYSQKNGQTGQSISPATTDVAQTPSNPTPQSTGYVSPYQNNQ